MPRDGLDSVAITIGAAMMPGMEFIIGLIVGLILLQIVLLILRKIARSQLGNDESSRNDR